MICVANRCVELFPDRKVMIVDVLERKKFTKRVMLKLLPVLGVLTLFGAVAIVTLQ